MATAQATARTNIALVKYWGKADLDANLPAVGSLSMTLDGLWTTTRVSFEPDLARDELQLDDQPAPEPARQRASRFLDLVRQQSGRTERARVVSTNSFPTAAGLASSASGFCALAAAATRAAGIDLPAPDLADLTRRGSGSAPRSLLGGFVELRPGDGCQVVQVAPADYWDLRLVIALCADGPKAVGSTEGMERSRRTSPYYDRWIDDHPADLDRARRAIAERELPALGRAAEASCFKMHALAMSSDPPLIYFQPATLAAVQRVWHLRAEGLVGYVTIDAGPHVKVLCAAADAEALAAELGRVDGVRRVMIQAPGPGVEVAA